MICGASRTTQRPCGPRSSKKSPPHRRILPLDQPTATQARTCEKNKGRTENRAIHTAPIHGEDIGFPLARQVARLLRQTSGRQDEHGALVSSAGPERLNASSWLRHNRGGWAIESGLHQRRDVSSNDDRSRVQSDHGIWIFGMFRRLAISLFMEWRSAQRRPDPVTTTSFQGRLAQENPKRAMRLLISNNPSLRRLS